MGNGLSPCLHMPATAAMPAAARLVYWGGQTRLLQVTDDEDDNGGCSFTAGDVAAELAAEHIVCAAESFFVGLPIPVVAPAERLLPGRAYFVLPAARFSAATRLTAATLASLAPPAPGTKKKTKNAVAVRIAGPGQCPFEYVKGAEDGAAPLIRVLPEFIEKVITCSDGNDSGGNGNGAAASTGGRRGRSKSRGRGAAMASAAETDEICSTPELKRHYAQLVGPRSRPWSPALETISERGKRSVLWSPARLLLSSR